MSECQVTCEVRFDLTEEDYKLLRRYFGPWASDVPEKGRNLHAKVYLKREMRRAALKVLDEIRDFSRHLIYEYGDTQD